MSKIQQAVMKSLLSKGVKQDRAQELSGNIAKKYDVKKYGKKVIEVAEKEEKDVSLVSYALKRYEKSQ